MRNPIVDNPKSHTNDECD